MKIWDAEHFIIGSQGALEDIVRHKPDELTTCEKHTTTDEEHRAQNLHLWKREFQLGTGRYSCRILWNDFPGCLPKFLQCVGMM